MNCDGKYCMVFRNEKGDNVWYNLSDSSKNIDGQYTNKNWNVRFKKGNEPEHFKKINFKGFFNYYKKDENTTYTTIQVMEWEYSEGSEQVKTQYVPTQPKVEENEDPFFKSTTDDIDTDEIPF